MRRSVVTLGLTLLLTGCGSGGEHARPATSGTTPALATAPTSTPASAPTSGLASAPPATSAPPTTRGPVVASPGSPAAHSPSALPAVSARARSAGLRDVRTVVPDAVIDLRYATRSNFTGVRLYPRTARCLVHRTLATRLAVAARAARRAGLRLVFWDCYRPHAVQQRMFRVVPNPNWVARPGPYARSHEAGRSVDVTLARGTAYLDMGTGFDDFSARATAFATRGVTSRAQRHRALLRKIMAAGGLTVYSGEWWHFDGPGANRNRAHLDAPVY